MFHIYDQVSQTKVFLKLFFESVKLDVTLGTKFSDYRKCPDRLQELNEIIVGFVYILNCLG